MEEISERVTQHGFGGLVWLQSGSYNRAVSSPGSESEVYLGLVPDTELILCVTLSKLVNFVLLSLAVKYKYDCNIPRKSCRCEIYGGYYYCWWYNHYWGYIILIAKYFLSFFCFLFFYF